MAENDGRTFMRRPVFSKCRVSLKTKLIFFIGCLVAGMLCMVALLVNHMISQTLEDQIGKRSLSVAKTIALMPEIRAAFDADDPSAIIHPIVEPIREETGAKFIVVGNTETVRYAHPLPDRIGKTMVGGDNERALQDGEFYVSKAVGSLGPSIRGKGPIFSENGEIIGIISVGFMEEEIETIIGQYTREVWMIVLILISLGTFGSFFIAQQFKKQIFGLEPYQIAQLFEEKDTILTSIHEGIIAINCAGRITMMNPAAGEILDVEDAVGQPIEEVLPDIKMVDILESGEKQLDQEMVIGRHIIIVNRVPIKLNGELTGVVASFRNKTEIERLSKELSRIKQYVETLRAQAHEFSNKLYIISGLLQLKKIDEVIEFIHSESESHQEWIQFLTSKIKDPMISALLLGKLNSATEAKVKLIVDAESELTYTPGNKEREAFMTVLGNIIQNAIEAALENESRSPVVRVLITDIYSELLFEVEDSGCGLSPEQYKHMFENGYTTKSGKNRGIGLAIVKQAVEELNGTIAVEESELGGACFIAVLPKTDKEDDQVRDARKNERRTVSA